jgi:DeoR/GlpR family transcriptional regulator of sugar metabolism
MYRPPEAANPETYELPPRIPKNMFSDTGEATIVMQDVKSSADEHQWRFVTNHAHVLECISADPETRLRDIAVSVGVTERTVAHIVGDLEQAGYLTRTRDGRRNRYEVHGELPLRHPRHRHRTVGDLIRFLETGDEGWE